MQRSWVTRLLTWCVLAPVRIYQRLISPLLPASCKFYPSCSAYAVMAVQTNGPIRGIGQAAWRLMRCHPWSLGGVDFPPNYVTPVEQEAQRNLSTTAEAM